MGKVKRIEKSRKECKCNRCAKVIPVGSSYLRGTLNFNPDIVRCTMCGLQAWEVTTSEYQLAVGEIVYRWSENHSADFDGVEDIKSELESIRDEQQEKLDNMPDSLRDADTGMLIQDRIDNLEGVINELDGFDEDGIKDTIMMNNDVDDWAEALEEEYDSEVTSFIEDALSGLEV